MIPLPNGHAPVCAVPRPGDTDVCRDSATAEKGCEASPVRATGEASTGPRPPPAPQNGVSFPTELRLSVQKLRVGSWQRRSGDIGWLAVTSPSRWRSVSKRLAGTDAFDDVAGGCLGGGSRQPPAVDRSRSRGSGSDRSRSRGSGSGPQAVARSQGFGVLA